MKIADINKMTKQEKLEAMENLWASLVQDESATNLLNGMPIYCKREKRK